MLKLCKTKIIITINKMISNRLNIINNNKINHINLNNFNIMIQVINYHTNKDKNQKAHFKMQDLDHNM